MSDTASASASTTAPGGGMPGSTMAGMTISQSSNPTQGLQGYDLQRRVLNLVTSSRRARLAAGTKRRFLSHDRRSASAPPGGKMAKDGHMNEISAMVGTLQKSVAGILESAADNRTELLEQTFTQFNAALAPALEKAAVDSAAAGAAELAKSAPEGTFEVPLYKGLGTVGRVATFVGMMANRIKSIKDGKDYSSDTDVDPCSEDVAELLDHSLAMAELAMRSAVNEHVDIAMDGDDADENLNFMAVPNAQDPENPDAAVVVKSLLPTDLLKFATDPASIDMTVVQLGAGLMLEGGFDEGALNKLFDGEQAEILGKGAPPDPNAGTDPNAPADMSGGAASGSGDGSADPNDPLAQLEVLGRIMAAGMMQTEHCMNLLETIMGVDPGTGASGGADPGDGSAVAAGAPAGDAGTPPDASADAGAPADATPGEAGSGGGGDAPPGDGTDPKKKPPMGKLDDGAMDLMKRAADENEALRKQVADLSAATEMAMQKIQELGTQPAPAKGVLMVTPMNKDVDSGGGGDSDALSKLASEYRRQRDDSGRNTVLLKAAIKGINASEILAKLA